LCNITGKAIEVNDLKTYISIFISSEGSKASRITEILCDMGFETTLGSHDFVYDWKNKEVTPTEVINFVDKVQNHLKGMNVRFSISTIK
jgi:hypothetical protein